VAIKMCSKQPASSRFEGQRCNATGVWNFSEWSDPYSYPFSEDSEGNLHVTSAWTSDPWLVASGTVQIGRMDRTPARCAGGLVPVPPGAGVDSQRATPDVTIHFNCSKGKRPSIVTHTGSFSADCNTLTMDDGGQYRRTGVAEQVPSARQQHTQNNEGSNCSLAPLTFTGQRKLSSSSAEATYILHSNGSGTVLQVNVTTSSLPTTATGSGVWRVQATLTSMQNLTFCVGGISILNRSISHASEETVILHGSSGGPAGAAGALQPWTCRVRGGSASENCTILDDPGAPGETPFEPHEPTQPIASIGSGVSGRSSNFQLPWAHTSPECSVGACN
jgi:hypothetical protein